MHFIIWLLINSIAVAITARLLPGVSVSGGSALLITTLILSFVNAFVRPILILLTLPLTVLTLGLSIFIINALLVLLVSAIVPGFRVDGFWWALLFSLILAIVNGLLQMIVVK